MVREAQSVREAEVRAPACRVLLMWQRRAGSFDA